MYHYQKVQSGALKARRLSVKRSHICLLLTVSSARLQAAITADAHALTSDRLATVTGEGVQRLVGWHRPLPLQAERARLLREVGSMRPTLHPDCTALVWRDCLARHFTPCISKPASPWRVFLKLVLIIASGLDSVAHCPVGHAR